MAPDIIVVGTSAGGVEALQRLVAQLPEDFAASVFIVIHTGANSPGLMARILTSAGDLPAVFPGDGDGIKPGMVYVAPPDHHMLLEEGRVRVVRGPKENRHRPAVDPLFRSAAVHYRSRVIGVILAGHLNDGTSGLAAVKECGGIAIVQDPDEAVAPGMPTSALQRVEVDHCVQLAEIPKLLMDLVSAPRTGVTAMSVPEGIQTEAQIAAMECQEMSVVDRLGERSTMTCPECGGTLWRVHDDKVQRYRCHVGHALTAEYLSGDQGDALEKALWVALKSLEEIAELALEMAARAEQDGDAHKRQQMEDRAKDASTRAEVLRGMLKKPPVAGLKRSQQESNGEQTSQTLNEQRPTE